MIEYTTIYYLKTISVKQSGDRNYVFHSEQDG